MKEVLGARGRSSFCNPLSEVIGSRHYREYSKSALNHEKTITVGLSSFKKVHPVYSLVVCLIFLVLGIGLECGLIVDK